jgi:membrane-bound inhibitor of C-type lysozyme
LHKLLPFNLTVAQVQELIKNKNHPFWAAFDQATKLLDPQPIVSATGSTVDTQKQIDFWISFYKKHFKIDLDPSEIKIAERRSGFNWLVIVAKGVSLNQVWEVCLKHFKCWKYDGSDLESLIQESERGQAKTSTAFWFRDRVEADEETKNLSANQQTEASITLIARCLLELKYFSETGKHLDLKNVTLCSGSRYADGCFPYALWGVGEFSVYWDLVDDRSPGLRSRVAVG